MASDMERTLTMKNEVFVYKIPPRGSNRGYRAADWKLDQPDWTGRLRVISTGQKLSIKLEDRNSGDLFASCPVESYPSPSVEQVTDSSRYFVIRIQDGGGRAATIGIGFADRGDSFDLMVSLQDHFKLVKRDEAEKNKPPEQFSAGPKLDLGFKEGQTIKININTQRGDEGGAKARPKPSRGGTGFLPPPPGSGGMKIAPPPQSSSSTVGSIANSGSDDLLAQLSQPFSANLISNPSPAQSSNANSVDLLGLGGPPLIPTQPPQSGVDPWGDFASASSGGQTKPAESNNAWDSGASWETF